MILLIHTPTQLSSVCVWHKNPLECNCVWHNNPLECNCTITLPLKCLDPPADNHSWNTDVCWNDCNVSFNISNAHRQGAYPGELAVPVYLSITFWEVQLVVNRGMLGAKNSQRHYINMKYYPVSLMYAQHSIALEYFSSPLVCCVKSRSERSLKEMGDAPPRLSSNHMKIIYSVCVSLDDPVWTHSAGSLQKSMSD